MENMIPQMGEAIRNILDKVSNFGLICGYFAVGYLLLNERINGIKIDMIYEWKRPFGIDGRSEIEKSPLELATDD